MANLLATTPTQPLVAASIMCADYARLAEDCRSVLDAGADLLHLDVMDAHFVPNLTMGPDLCSSLRRALPEACFDVHLMVSDPGLFTQPFADAGADHLTFHLEAMPTERELDAARALVDRVHDLGMTAGIALKPPTSLDRLDGLLGELDLVLIMSIDPGFAGQAFMPGVLDKTRALLAQVVAAVSKLPNQIAIKGHTDATPFHAENGYGNWELSTDRANASRRALVAAGLTPERIESVVGRADQEPLLPDDPYSPRNRRISIILLREAPPASR